MREPVSIAGQILSLHDRGYDPDQIVLEMKSNGLRVTKERVRATIQRASSRAEDSRRLFEVWEMLIEVLAILRELKGRPGVAARMRQIETHDLVSKLGAAIDRATPRE